MEITSEIDHIVWNYSEQRVVIGLSEVSKEFSDNAFEIAEENFITVLENGGEKTFKIGTSVTVIAAPKCFGDGYIMPIVAIKVDEQELLDYQEGYEGLMESYCIFD